MTSFGSVVRFTTESFSIHNRIVFDSHRPLFTFYMELLLRRNPQKIQTTAEDWHISD